MTNKDVERLYQANVNLVDKNSILEAENKMLIRKFERIEKWLVKEIKNTKNEVIVNAYNNILEKMKEGEENEEE